MKKNYSFKDCYKILNLTPENNWSEIRKAYKKLIQKWHPDRFEDNSQEKSAADIKIKAINIAYDQIHKYYQSNNNTLPQIEESPQPAQSTVNKTTSTEAQDKKTQPASNKKQTTTKSQKNKNTTTKKTFQNKQTASSKHTYLKKLVTIAILGSIYYLFADDIQTLLPNNSLEENRALYPDSNKKNTPSTPITTRTHLEDNLALEPKEQATPANLISPKSFEALNDVFFTHGSSIADVINIQGIPSKIDGDIWYYGKSKVYFKNGTVTDWVRSTKTPLEARVVLEKRTNLN